MAFTANANPDIVKTLLDELFLAKFNEASGPNMAKTTDSMIFRQSSTDMAGINTEVMSDGGSWEQTEESEDLTESTPKTGDARFFKVSKYAQSLPITKEMLDDNQFEAVARQVEAMARKGRLTDEKVGFGLYRGGFTTTLTNAGVALFSDSHTNLNGDTVDNLGAASALSESTLNDGIVALMEQKDQAGDIVGYEPNCLLVAPALFKKACEITESELRSGTGNNDINVYSSKYGIYVKQSRYLGAAAGGSDTAYFLLSKDHNITRWERQGIETDYVDYKFSSNDTAYYKGRYRNVYGALSYEGVWASAGA